MRDGWHTCRRDVIILWSPLCHFFDNARDQVSSEKINRSGDTPPHYFLFAVKGAQPARSIRRVRRTPRRALCSRSRLHLAQASCRHRILPFGFFFTVVTQKVRRALAQPVALSATLFMFAHAPLFLTNFHICCPPAGSVCACSRDPVLA